MGLLAGKSIIVTGASGGIGSATAQQCAQEGAHVVVHYSRSKERADATIEKIRLTTRRLKPPIKALALKADVNNPKEIAELVQTAIRELGRIDGLACLHGYPAAGLWTKRLEEYTDEEWLQVFQVDVKGSLAFAQAVAPHMLRQRAGAIVLTSSTPAIAGHDMGGVFTVAKAGVAALAKHLALRYKPHIRVNAIAPGNIRTKWLKELSASEREAAARESPLARLGEPEEVAKPVAFLLSDYAGYINGQTLIIDGGTVMR